MLETISFLERLLIDGDVVVLGLSGGQDSMCLLDILCGIKKRISIIAAHINHNIREESNSEALFIKDYCSNRNIILETTKFNKKSSNTNYSEAELREKRYQYFEKIIKKYKAKYLFTAHHGDDLIETILMRITRGSDLKGYAGFDLITNKDSYQVIKPLIYTTKNDIEEYNKKNKIPSVEDKTNKSDKYTRNRYRKKVLPFLKEENPKVHLKYLKFSEELKKYYDYVDNVITKEMNVRYKDNTLSLDNIELLDDFIIEGIIKKILDYNYPDNLYLVSDRHTKLLKKVIYNNKPNIDIPLPGNILIKKRYNKLYITGNSQNNNDYYIKITKHTKLPNNHYIDTIEEQDNNSNYCIRLNSEELVLPLYVRTRKNGDKIRIKNLNGAKKIKDIFIDLKLDKDQRQTQPIVVDKNDTIIWLPGLKKSEFSKAKNEEYDIILWYN